MSHRTARAILIAVCCGLTVLFSKTLQLPETALSAYLIFFASREEAMETVLNAVGLCIAAVFALGLAIVLVMATAGAPLPRVVMMFAVTFIAMYAAGATSAGVIAATLGMVLFEVLVLIDFVPYPDLVLRALFWLLPVVFVPMSILALANLIFGRDAIWLLKQRALHRSELTNKTSDIARQKACAQELLKGNAEFAKLHRIGRISGTLSHWGDAELLANEDTELRKIAACAAGRRTDDVTQPIGPLANSMPMKPNANPDAALRFAVKSTLAIAICYVIFVVLDWPAIHTITITAFLVCLGSTAETLHKAALRMSGCLIGAAISGVCLLFIVPHLSSAAELALLTTVVALPAAWIAVGPERTAYAGMQIALVFLLAVTNTAGATVDLGIAWGRIVGIIMGNLVVAVVFLTLWPTNNLKHIRTLLSRVEIGLRGFSRSTVGAGLSLGRMSSDLKSARDALDIATIDPLSNHTKLTSFRRQTDILAGRIVAAYGKDSAEPHASNRT